jgi:hypothetical protein
MNDYVLATLKPEIVLFQATSKNCGIHFLVIILPNQIKQHKN